MYLWYDRPLYDEFGEAIVHLQGDTIYLYQDSPTPVRDLFHELGHVVGRKCNLVGNAENGFRGDWEQENGKLIAEISGQRHWSSYLNLFSLAHSGFRANAASEVWAELFMLWHLSPDCAEARLLDEPMERLHGQPVYAAISNLALELDLQPAQTDSGNRAWPKRCFVVQETHERHPPCQHGNYRARPGCCDECIGKVYPGYRPGPGLTNRGIT